MNRRTLLNSLLGAAPWAWSGCSRNTTGPAGRVLRVSASPYLANSPFYLALEKGYFNGAGLRLQLQEYAHSPQAIPLLAAGKLDVALFAIGPSFLNAVAKGARIRIVAGREVTQENCGTTGVLYGRGRDFPKTSQDLRKLKGKRIAVTRRASLTEWFLDIILESAGMSSADVQVVTIGLPEAAAALVGGKIEAMIGFQSDRELASLSSQIVRGISVAELVPNLQFSHVFFGQSLLDGDPAAGARFLSAYLRGAREFLAGVTPRFLDDYARANGLDLERTRKACRSTFAADGSIDLASLRRFVDWAVRKGYCARGVQPVGLVDTRFLELALKESRRL